MRTIPIIDGHLKCSKCGEVKPVSEFSKGKNKNGYKSHCKECVHKAYLADKERILKQHKDYYEENKEKYLSDCKRYRDSHREERKEYFAQYYIDNAEHLKQKNRDHFQNLTEEQRQDVYAKANARRKNEQHRAYMRDKRQYRKALVDNLPSDFTKEQWLFVVQFFGNTCAYCGKKKKLTQEHIIPVSRGGGYTKNNIIPCCGSCNSSKQDRELVEWFKSKDYFSEERLEKIKEVMQWQ